jgi:3-hydroxyacyl-[acyl-carrier-protein] dehydratase
VLKKDKLKLLHNLFDITESLANESSFIVKIKLFPGHIIYSGHFPGYPVTPGAVQLQIIHELIENHFGKSIKLIALDDCKFLKIVNPEERKQIQISVEFVINDPLLQVRAAGKYDLDIFIKLKGIYRFI